MDLVIDLATRNVQHGGGPFAAAVFELKTGRLVSPGVNLVLPLQCSVLHAEIVATALAQQIIGSYTLRGHGNATFELVSSSEPCAMCLGAIQWAGFGSLVCGARDEDVRAVGFEEGMKPLGWVEAFRSAGIAVTQDVLRDQATAALSRYVTSGRPVYNG
jgi:tRNA(Arg) A34 adenosine deaminase TadA